MTAIGMETLPVLTANHSPADAERRRRPNTVGADLMISLRFERQPTPAANGVACFTASEAPMVWYPPSAAISPIHPARSSGAHRFTRLSHGRTWDLLRLTRMPTVQADIGNITIPHDQARLVTRECSDATAEGIPAAVKRFTLLGKNTAPPETLSLSLKLLAHEQSVDHGSPGGLKPPSSSAGALHPHRPPPPAVAPASSAERPPPSPASRVPGACIVSGSAHLHRPPPPGRRGACIVSGAKPQLRRFEEPLQRRLPLPPSSRDPLSSPTSTGARAWVRCDDGESDIT